MLENQLPCTPPVQVISNELLTFPTPLTIRGLKKEAEIIQKLVLTPTTKNRINAFTKGSLIQVNEGYAHAHELEDLQDRKCQRARRQKTSQRQVQKNGILYSKDARKMKQHREESELEKAQVLVIKAKKSQAVREMKEFKKFHVAERKRLRALKALNPGTAVVHVEVVDPAGNIISYSV